MVKLRLKRVGKKGQPSYKIVVMPSKNKRDGKAIEYIGSYNPKSKMLTLNEDRALYWLSVGAKPTDTVYSLLSRKKLVEQVKRVQKSPKLPKKKLGEKPSESPKSINTIEKVNTKSDKEEDENANENNLVKNDTKEKKAQNKE